MASRNLAYYCWHRILHFCDLGLLCSCFANAIESKTSVQNTCDPNYKFQGNKEVSLNIFYDDTIETDFTAKWVTSLFEIIFKQNCSNTSLFLNQFIKCKQIKEVTLLLCTCPFSTLFLACHNLHENAPKETNQINKQNSHRTWNNSKVNELCNGPNSPTHFLSFPIIFDNL